MLTSTGLSLGILLLALVSKALRHKKRQVAENLCVRVCVPAHSKSGESGEGGGPIPIAVAISLEGSVC